MSTKYPIYFIGIGGIGMSSLAQFFIKNGHTVGGYDLNLSEITEKLNDLGAIISNNDNLKSIPDVFKKNKNTLVIYTPAVPQDLAIIKFFKKKKFAIKKRAEVLGELSNGKKCIAVAGTHGKTSTSVLLSHIMLESGKKITSFVGGIYENMKTNFISNGNDIVIIEADEFDKSFMHLNPDYIVLNSMDSDHLDIYGSHDEVISTYKQFSKKVKIENRYVRHGLEIKGRTFGIEKGEYKISNVSFLDDKFFFDFESSKVKIKQISTNFYGKHNLLNIAAAISVALKFDCSANDIINSIKTFKGISRRFSIKLKTPKIIIDDYAHHPKEIDAVYDTLTEMYPKSRKLVVFQPHLFSRTKDFANEFKSSLKKFDEIILLKIYPAREKSIEGIVSEILLDKEHHFSQVLDKNRVPEKVIESKSDVVVFLGAGDIYKISKEVVTKFKNLKSV